MVLVIALLARDELRFYRLQRAADGAAAERAVTAEQVLRNAEKAEELLELIDNGGPTTHDPPTA